MKFKYIVLLLIMTFRVFAQSPTQEDISEIAYHHLEMAKNGDAESQFFTSQVYWHGWGGAQNSKLAIRWLEKSVEQSYPPAIYNLGQRYLMGVGIKQDRDLGIKLLKEASTLKVSDALVTLGSYYLGFNPEGDLIDSKTGKDYLLESVKQGNSNGMLCLGLMYQRGLEPEASLDADINIERSIYWYERSAKSLNIYAIGNLGLLHWHPYHQNIDYKKAYFWFRVAKLAGTSEWSMQLTETELSLNEASRNKMNIEAEEWYKTHKNKNQLTPKGAS